ncbi:MAG: right-handed parallel beta-helix repeat-containing protein [Chthoniobacterales bacterium]
MAFLVGTSRSNCPIALARGAVFLASLCGTVHTRASPTPTPTPSPSHLANISTRLNVGVDDDVLIGGFIVRGPDTKKVILRALGPSLTGAGVIGAMANPTLELHDSTGATIATNDNWQTSAQVGEIGASGLAPTNPLESAILATLQPGNYTAIVRGVNNTTGIALVEGYELDSTATRLVNVSTRGRVGIGDEVLIGGVIVTGSDSKRVIVRALGPSLGTGAHPLAGALANPVLELRDRSGNLLSTNDNWVNSPQHAAIVATGLAPPNSLESAILTMLSPGNYTAIVRGAANTTGIGLVEVYDLDPDASPTPTPSPTPSPTPTPTPTPTPQPTPTQEVWIAVRTDGVAGSGTESDPYDGSTMDKFDAIMGDNSKTAPYTTIHLGPGTFRTSVTKPWWVRSVWVIAGAGMYDTTVQLAGNVSGMHYGISCLTSNPNVATDNVVVRDLTCDANWAEISTTADTGNGGEKNIKTGAVVIWGSNNLIERVRSINTYGSWANLQEQFAIFLCGPRSADGTNNVIQFCRAELPQGNYGNPFALAGWVWGNQRLITNSKVASCIAVGVNDGLAHGFTTGGVNLANVKDCQIDGNAFTDCSGAAYIDTGSVDGLSVTNNTVIRGWKGVGLASSTLPKQNITISGNNFSIQNRVPAGASCGIVAGYGATTNLTISNNTISFDNSGGGLAQFWGITASPLTNATISNNTVGPSINQVSGTGVTLLNNRHPDGTPVPGL